MVRQSGLGPSYSHLGAPAVIMCLAAAVKATRPGEGCRHQLDCMPSSCLSVIDDTKRDLPISNRGSSLVLCLLRRNNKSL
jgi:hypothetical protein